MTDKEVLNLTGGLFPVKLVEPYNENRQSTEPVQPWVYTPIIQRNTKIGPIYHWVKQSQAKKIYHGEKFNVEPDIIEFSQEEYKQALPSAPWSYADVKEIFTLLKTYNLNFIVVNDRLGFEKPVDQESQMSIEDLKEIYFTTTRAILNLRGQKQHPLANYVFDKKYETNRKFELEKFMMREKANTEQERFLINEIRRLEILIKK